MTGFNSKRDAAADKLQKPKREALKLALEALENHEGNYKLNDAGCDRLEAAITAIKAALAQPAQEQCQKHGECFGGECIYPPTQEPVAYVTGMSFGRFIVEPLNRAMVLPVGMALYSSPQENT